MTQRTSFEVVWAPELARELKITPKYLRALIRSHDLVPNLGDSILRTRQIVPSDFSDPHFATVHLRGIYGSSTLGGSNCLLEAEATYQ